MAPSEREQRRRRQRRVVIVACIVAAVLVLALVAIGLLVRDDSNDEPGAFRTEAATTVDETTSTEPTTTTTTRGRRGSGEPVTFAFAGDVHFEGHLAASLAAGPEGLLAPIAPVLSRADVAVVNLETAVTDRGTPATKEYVFRTSPAAFTALRGAGVDVVSMANNHGLDYGPVGLEDSLAAESATQFPVIGIGRNAAEAYSPFRIVVRGQRVAVIAATQVLDENLAAAWTATDTQAGMASAKNGDALVAAVAAARADTDTLVVFLHWGVERQTCPSSTQQELARRLADAGADIVVGSHAHVLQGAGRLDSTLVAYGLGNFVFYNESGPAGISGVLEVTATGRKIDGYSWVPARLRNGVPVPLDGAPADADRAAWTALRDCTGLAL